MKKPLDYEKRKQIKRLLDKGYTKTSIAKEIGVDRGTIIRELKKIDGVYEPDEAQRIAEVQRNYVTENDVIVNQVRIYFMSGMPDKKIAEILNISRPSVKLIKDKINEGKY